MMDQPWYQNASVGAGDFQQIPYWLLNKAPNEDTRYRAMFNLSVKYQFNACTLQARGSASLSTTRMRHTCMPYQLCLGGS